MTWESAKNKSALAHSPGGAAFSHAGRPRRSPPHATTTGHVRLSHAALVAVALRRGDLQSGHHQPSKEPHAIGPEPQSRQTAYTVLQPCILHNSTAVPTQPSILQPSTRCRLVHTPCPLPSLPRIPSAPRNPCPAQPSQNGNPPPPSNTAVVLRFHPAQPSVSEAFHPISCRRPGLVGTFSLCGRWMLGW